MNDRPSWKRFKWTPGRIATVGEVGDVPVELVSARASGNASRQNDARIEVEGTAEGSVGLSEKWGAEKQEIERLKKVS